MCSGSKSILIIGICVFENFWQKGDINFLSNTFFSHSAETEKYQRGTFLCFKILWHWKFMVNQRDYYDFGQKI